MNTINKSITLSVALAVWSGLNVGVLSAQQNSRPNFLVIITDDQRYDTMDYMPLTTARIFEQGAAFEQAYITTPVCCPSRASIFTGMYARHHGVRVNKDTLRYATFMERLHAAGYFTGLIGKYLNSWDGSARPEFDYWVSHANGDSRYYNPQLNVNGAWSVNNGYITNILRDHALEFLRRAGQRTDPFVLVFTPNAPHQPADPGPGDGNLYPDLPQHRPPSFNEEDVSDKPRWLRGFLRWDSTQIRKNDDLRRKQLQSLHALDQALNNLFNLLEQQGKLNNTLVMFISDNGYFWGEHRLKEKLRVYEEASRVPFAVRYPPLIAAGQVSSALVANLDLAPTIYDLANIPMPAEVDGRSLVPLLLGNSSWREELLIQGWREVISVPYVAVHDRRYVYVETENDSPELYDLQIDPFQLENRVKDASYASTVANLKQKLGQLTSVNEKPPARIKDFSLVENYPNPFNPGTTFEFSLLRASEIRLHVYDVAGRLVAKIFEGRVDAGKHEMPWYAGAAVATGVYVAVLQGQGISSTRKILLLR